MDSSLSRSLRSLIAAAALLAAAYAAIAASPGASASVPPMINSAVLLSDVKQELGFGVARVRSAGADVAVERDDQTMPASSALPWVFAGLCLAVCLAQRRFFVH